MLNLKQLLSGGEQAVPFTVEYDLVELSSDITNGKCVVKGVCTGHPGYITFTATYHLDYTAVCARCGEEYKGKSTFEFTSSVTDKLENNDKDQDEYLILQDGMLDIDGINMSMVVLNLPTRFLCRENCKGLCDGCGVNLNKGECSCPKVRIDPRMEKLKHFFD